MKTSIPILMLAILPFFIACNPQPDTLRQGFLNPPDSARPGVYWYFMDGNLNKTEMTADLESMKEAGIGYVLFLEVNVGVKRGPVDFLSDEWQSLFVHAVRECERLGIRLVMGSGPGWAGSGGPWVKPEQSMMHLASATKQIKGPGKHHIQLPIPQPYTPIFGEHYLPDFLNEIRDAWYEDVAVLAYPTPSEDFTLTDITEKAHVYRQPYTSVEGVKPFLPMPAVYPDHAEAAYQTDQIMDLTDKLLPDGSLDWEVPAGNWTIIRMGKRNNGAMTRPAPKPGLGLECDKFSAAAMDDHFDHYLGLLLDKVGPRDSTKGGGWTNIHIDSWEMGAQNWTHDFREQFTRRRAYDPLPYLPAYSGQIVGSTEITERFLWDVRLTGMELILENHANEFKKLGQQYGMPLSIEPYDMNPAADLDLGAVADIPMCEFWTNGYGFNSAFSCLESTSIGHVLGKKVIPAEAFTAMSNEAWQMYPGNMKNQSDWAFAMGINRFFYHTFVHKAYGEDKRPGMTMGSIGVHWDRGQTWWNFSRAYHDYITRSQFVLSQGTPVADILYLTPEGAPQVFVPPASALSGTDTLPDKKGFSFDGCSPKMLMEYASVKNHKIIFDGGGSYELLVLPNVETMTPELLAKLEELLRQGARIIGVPPRKSPSLVNYPECDQQVAEYAEKLWTRQDSAYKIMTAEYPENDLYPTYSFTAKILQNFGIQPDLKASDHIRYHHQHHPDKEVYFISNKTTNALTETLSFRSGYPHAEFWDPVSGEITKLPVSMENDRYQIQLKLDVWGSGFVVFQSTDRKVKKQKFQEVQQTKLDLNKDWLVRFDTSWGGPEEILLDSLVDWKEHANEGIKYYSGTATYEKDFTLSEELAPDQKYILSLGEVNNLAQVSLNGQTLTTCWTYPWEVDITGAIIPGKNHLEIKVANRWINRLIRDAGLPENKRLTWTTYSGYKPSDKLVPGGLVGPVLFKSN